MIILIILIDLSTFFLVNDEEQNIEENIAVAEVDAGLGWGLNYELPMNRRSEFVTPHLPKRIMQREEITSVADRLKLSDNKTAMIVFAVIKALVETWTILTISLDCRSK